MADPGPIEAALTAELAALDLGDLTLARVAQNLARTLDAGAGLATAAVARELRATLEAIKRGDDDSAALDAFIAGLSSPVRHPSD